MSVSNGPRRGLMINALTGDNFDTDFRKLLRALDALLDAAVINLTTSAPPGSPTNGDAYIVKASGSGAWSGHDNALAIWTTDNPSAPSGEWEFYAAAEGMIVVNVADGLAYVWNGSAWTAAGGGSAPNFADDETPGGTFPNLTLAHTPVAGSLRLFNELNSGVTGTNGFVLCVEGVHYTIVGSAITVSGAPGLSGASNFRAWYRY